MTSLLPLTLVTLTDSFLLQQSEKEKQRQKEAAKEKAKEKQQQKEDALNTNTDAKKGEDTTKDGDKSEHNDNNSISNVESESPAANAGDKKKKKKKKKKSKSTIPAALKGEIGREVWDSLNYAAFKTPLPNILPPDDVLVTMTPDQIVSAIAKYTNETPEHLVARLRSIMIFLCNCHQPLDELLQT